MSAQHTPGPWTEWASPAHGYRIRTSDASALQGFGSGDVAVVFFAGNGRSPRQCKADAHLIAAAPELLHAAKAVAFSNGFDAGLPMKLDALRAAIAKAEGGTS